jgi:hypothetical protein
MSRVVEKAGRRSKVPTSDAMQQGFQDSADQVNPTQSIAPVSMVNRPTLRRTRPDVMQREVDTEARISRRPNLVRPHGSQVARKSVAPFPRDRNLYVNDDDTCIQKDSTRKRRSFVLGKRKTKPHPCLTSDVCGSAPRVSVVNATSISAQLRGQDVWAFEGSDNDNESRAIPTTYCFGWRRQQTSGQNATKS